MNSITLTRDFPITLTIGQALELKRQGLLDVFELPTSPEQLQSIIADPVLFARVLWEMTDQSRFTFKAFAELLASVDQTATWEALTTAIVSFFPPEMRPLMNALAASVRDARNECASRMLKSLQKSLQQNESEPISEIGTQFGTMPASLVSSHFHSPTLSLTECLPADRELSGVAQAS